MSPVPALFTRMNAKHKHFGSVDAPLWWREKKDGDPLPLSTTPYSHVLRECVAGVLQYSTIDPASVPAKQETRQGRRRSCEGPSTRRVAVAACVCMHDA